MITETQSDSLPAKRKGRSIKPQPVKAAVVLSHAAGDSNAKIGRDLGITVNTVKRILSESEIDSYVKVGRSRVAEIIPKAAAVLDASLDVSDPDGNLALAVLEKTGVVGKAAGINIHLPPAPPGLEQSMAIAIKTWAEPIPRESEPVSLVRTVEPEQGEKG